MDVNVGWLGPLQIGRWRIGASEWQEALRKVYAILSDKWQRTRRPTRRSQDPERSPAEPASLFVVNVHIPAPPTDSTHLVYTTYTTVPIMSSENAEPTTVPPPTEATVATEAAAEPQPTTSADAPAPAAAAAAEPAPAAPTEAPAAEPEATPAAPAPEPTPAEPTPAAEPTAAAAPVTEAPTKPEGACLLMRLARGSGWDSDAWSHYYLVRPRCPAIRVLRAWCARAYPAVRTSVRRSCVLRPPPPAYLCALAFEHRLCLLQSRSLQSLAS